MSAAVNTPSTPGAAFASSTSIEVIVAWAIGERAYAT